MKITLPADPKSLGRLRTFLADAFRGIESGEADRLTLAVQEAATNYMKYAERAEAGCPLEVRVLREGDRVTVRIPSFCAEAKLDEIRPRELDDVRPGGLGTHFIREIMDDVEYRPDASDRSGCDGQMTLILTKRVQLAPDASDAPNDPADQND